MTAKADAPVTDGKRAADGGVALFDERPFFEKALAYGVAHGLIGAERLEALRTEAPKGMVQIARYFGTEYLRPDLEKACERMVNLVSLYLQDSCDGDLQRAAQALRDHSLLSRSKGGSDLLKAMIAMPQNTHFGMQDGRGFLDEHIPILERWSLRSHADYRAERTKRQSVTNRSRSWSRRVECRCRDQISWDRVGTTDEIKSATAQNVPGSQRG
jgi:hypothetical protein